MKVAIEAQHKLIMAKPYVMKTYAMNEVDTDQRPLLQNALPTKTYRRFKEHQNFKAVIGG